MRKLRKKHAFYVVALAAAAITPVVAQAAEECTRSWYGEECSWRACGDKFWREKVRYLECPNKPTVRFVVDGQLACDCLTGS